MEMKFRIYHQLSILPQLQGGSLPSFYFDGERMLYDEF